MRLNEEDLDIPYDARSYDEHDLSGPHKKERFSYIKLFLTITFSAPVAALLVLVVIDLYEPVALMVGLSTPEPEEVQPIIKVVSAPAPAPTPAPAKVVTTGSATLGAPGMEKRLDSLANSIESSNSKIVTAINKQTEALSKLASRKPDVVKVSQSSGEQSASKIVVVKVPSREKFDLDYEIQKIMDLSGIDLDDPINSSSSFDKIKSRDVMKELIRSLDAIIGASVDHPEVGEFLKSNALTAKKYARARLGKM